MQVRYVTAHGIHDLRCIRLQKLRHSLIHPFFVPEEIGKEQRSCQAVPAAVGSSAVNGGGNGILFVAEQANA